MEQVAAMAIWLCGSVENTKEIKIEPGNRMSIVCKQAAPGTAWGNTTTLTVPLTSGGTWSTPGVPGIGGTKTPNTTTPTTTK